MVSVVKTWNTVASTFSAAPCQGPIHSGKDMVVAWRDVAASTVAAVRPKYCVANSKTRTPINLRLNPAMNSPRPAAGAADRDGAIRFPGTAGEGRPPEACGVTDCTSSG